MVVARQYSQLLKSDWDRFLEGCRTPLFMFNRGFVEYHSDRFCDESLMFYEDENLVALFPATRSGSELVSHGGLTFGGLLFAAKARASLVIDVFNSLVEYARSVNIEKITYKAIPYIFADQGAQEDLYALTCLNAVLVRRDLSSVIHLSNRFKLSKGRKWLIARAKNKGLLASLSEDWHEFHELLSSALQRHNASPVHSPEELQLLHSRFAENIELKIIRHEGRMLAGALLFHFGQVTHTQYLATNDEGKELGALDALVETCIQESEAKGDKYFSFGISTEKGGRFLNSGLINQKENFGARGLVLDFYEMKIN